MDTNIKSITAIIFINLDSLLQEITVLSSLNSQDDPGDHFDDTA
jgi:hypothetical protein